MATYTSSAAARSVTAAIDGLKRSAQASPDAGLALVVPFMGRVGRRLCEKARVSWLDLSGNAKIVAPELRIWIEGRPNKYVERAGRRTCLLPRVRGGPEGGCTSRPLCNPFGVNTEADRQTQGALGTPATLG
jgi:hypothetical protein